MTIPSSRSTQLFCWVVDDNGMFWFLEKDLAALLRYDSEQLSRIPEAWCKKVDDYFDDPWHSCDLGDIILNEWAFYFLIHQCVNGIPFQKWLNVIMTNNNDKLTMPGEKVSIHEPLKLFVQFTKDLKLEYMPASPGTKYMFLLLKEKQPKHSKFAYRAIRCQKRNLWNLIKWLDPNQFEPVLYRENLIYAQSILSISKEMMRHQGLRYGSTSNHIECDNDHLEKCIKDLIQQLVGPHQLDILMNFMSEAYPEEWYRLCSRWNRIGQHGYTLRSAVEE